MSSQGQQSHQIRGSLTSKQPLFFNLNKGKNTPKISPAVTTSSDAASSSTDAPATPALSRRSSTVSTHSTTACGVSAASEASIRLTQTRKDLELSKAWAAADRELRVATAQVTEIEGKLAAVEAEENRLKGEFEELKRERDEIRSEKGGRRGRVEEFRRKVRECEGVRRDALEELKKAQQPFIEAREKERRRRAAFEKENPHNKRYIPLNSSETAAQRELRELKVVKPFREKFEAAKDAEDEARKKLREQESVVAGQGPQGANGNSVRTLSLQELEKACNLAHQIWRAYVVEKPWQPLREELRKAQRNENWWKQDVDWYRKKCIIEEPIEEDEEI